ncbi:MAG: flippase-like domain-containing protein [Geobacter sp.]|nr:flippase-like domain-containing protein [Geobacter sp.]
MNRSGRVDAKFLIGIGISLFFLVLLFRKIDFNQLAAAFRTLDYRYLAAAILVTLFSISFRAVRWHYLILPMKRARPRYLLSATVICYLGNNLLPARLGEFLRAMVLAEKEELEVSAVFATLVIDRLFDGFSVLLILVVTFFTITLPPGMEKVQQGLVTGGYVTLALYVAVIGFLVLLKRVTARTLHVVGVVLSPFPKGLSDRIIPLLGSFISGIRLSNRPGELLAILFSSMVIWVSAAWPIDLVLKAFGITLPITASLFILVFLVFAVMVPASPGYVGTYHAACMYGLMAFNIPKELSLSVALVVHAVSFFPVIFYGFYFLWRDRISFTALKSAGNSKG